MMVFEFRITIVAEETAIVDALNAAQADGFEFVTAAGMSGQVTLFFRRPKIIHPVEHVQPSRRHEVLQHC